MDSLHPLLPEDHLFPEGLLQEEVGVYSGHLHGGQGHLRRGVLLDLPIHLLQLLSRDGAPFLGCISLCLEVFHSLVEFVEIDLILVEELRQLLGEKPVSAHDLGLPWELSGLVVVSLLEHRVYSGNRQLSPVALAARRKDLLICNGRSIAFWRDVLDLLHFVLCGTLRLPPLYIFLDLLDFLLDSRLHVHHFLQEGGLSLDDLLELLGGDLSDKHAAVLHAVRCHILPVCNRVWSGLIVEGQKSSWRLQWQRCILHLLHLRQVFLIHIGIIQVFSLRHGPLLRGVLVVSGDHEGRAELLQVVSVQTHSWRGVPSLYEPCDFVLEFGEPGVPRSVQVVFLRRIVPVVVDFCEI
mmetsp:Transcript_16063/g.32548  ORF Transcript_16063/g.32548 Transcript_16063/m.32548 type:complete len:352 (-) Transcript_16063:111-1166(-)